MSFTKETVTITSKTAYKRTSSHLLSWYWPTDQERAAWAEGNLFRHLAKLPVDDPNRFRHLKVMLPSASADPERFINTVVIDQAGFDNTDFERVDVVIVNGLGAALGVFYRNLDELSRTIPNARIWAIDWLGMGRSGRPVFPSNPRKDSPLEGINYFLDSFEEWRSVLSQPDTLEKFILVGHSLGGYLAALYALKFPGRVIKLVLASPAGLPPDSNGPEVEEAMGGPVAVTGQVIPAWLNYLWANNFTPQWFLRGFGPFGPMLVRTYVAKRLPNLPEEDKMAFAEYMYHVSAETGSGEYALGTILKPGAWAREPLHDRIDQLSMPTTFIYGSDDWMDYRHAEEAASRMTVPVKIVRVARSGHQLYLENPIDFNRVVAEECTL